MTYMFFVFTFILLTAIVLTAKDTLRAMFAAGLVVNFLGITQHLIKFHKMDIFGTGRRDPSAGEPDIVEAMTGENSAPVDDSISDVYGEQYEDYMSYKTSYDAVAPTAVCADAMYGVRTMDTSADLQAMLMEQRRTRDKRAIDGRVTKDINYYRHHFADELREAERKPWWGRNEW